MQGIIWVRGEENFPGQIGEERKRRGGAAARGRWTSAISRSGNLYYPEGWERA